MRQLGGLRRSFAALLVLGLGVVFAGCAQMSNPTYDIGEIGCATASDSTLAKIQEKVTADGTLRNGKTVKSGEDTFVSAELHLQGSDKHKKGDILTWVTTNVDGDEFSSVDVNAREDSSWPDADITVTTTGARESRACANASLGKTKAQVQCELDQATGDIPADRKCDEL